MEKANIVEFIDYKTSVKDAFDSIKAGDILKSQKLILIKPNLIDSLPFPITSNSECIGAIIDYIRMYTDARIIIGEGCGAPDKDTFDVFKDLGIDILAKEKNVELIDLNYAPLVKLENKNLKIFPFFYMPKIVMESFVINTPVLKKHSLAIVTLALKNMLGVAPSRYYQKGGHWKKSAFHSYMHESIVELNIYRKADLVLLDASVGMCEYHLGGAKCSPPVNKLVAGYSSVEVDKIGTKLLGLNWKDIPHIVDGEKYLL